MDALSRKMSTIVNGRLLSGFSVGSRNNDEFLVSYLLFSNDTVIFYEANHNYLCHLICLLCFEVISGLKINFSK